MHLDVVAQRFHLVEHEEEHEVEAHVHAVDARGEQLDEREEHLLVALDVPTHENAAPNDERGERKQQDVEAVCADGVVRIEHREPRDVGKESERKRSGEFVRGFTRESVHAVGEEAYDEKDDCRGGGVNRLQYPCACRGERNAYEYRKERDYPDEVEKYRFHVAPTGEAGRRNAR